MKIIPVIMLIFGISFIVFNRQVSEGTMQYQKDFFGVDQPIWAYRIPFYLGGALSTILSLTAILN